MNSHDAIGEFNNIAGFTGDVDIIAVKTVDSRDASIFEFTIHERIHLQQLSCENEALSRSKGCVVVGNFRVR